MDGSATLENLRSEGGKAQFENIPVGRVLVHIEEALQIQIHILQRDGGVGKALRDKVNPDARAHIQLQHADAGGEEVRNALLPGRAHPKDILEVDVGEDIEAVHRFDGNIVGRSGKFLGVQVCHDKSPPEEGSVPVQRHPVLPWVGGEEAQVVEIVRTEDIDTGFGCLDRGVEIITPSLPRDLDGRHSGEGHLLRWPGVPPLGDLAPPRDPLVFGAHLRVVFESEHCHRTFLLRV